MHILRKLFLPSSANLLRLLIVAIFLFGLMPVPALATENGTIAGQVTDSSTSNAISGVSIYVFAGGSPSPDWSGNTDSNGDYSIPVPEEAGYQVTARKVGYIVETVTGKDVTVSCFYPESSGYFRDILSITVQIHEQGYNQESNSSLIFHINLFFRDHGILKVHRKG